MRIINIKDYNDMSRKAASIISSQVILKPDSILGLATGSTPLGAYKLLSEWCAKGDVDFHKCRAVNLDEYVGLGPEDEQSYVCFMRENLFIHINIDINTTSIPNGKNLDDNDECEPQLICFVTNGSPKIPANISASSPCCHFLSNSLSVFISFVPVWFILYLIFLFSTIQP